LRRSPRRTWPTQWCTRPADHPTSRWEGNDEGSVALSPPLHLQEQSVSPKPLNVCVCARARASLVSGRRRVPSPDVSSAPVSGRPSPTSAASCAAVVKAATQGARAAAEGKPKIQPRSPLLLGVCDRNFATHQQATSYPPSLGKRHM
jgi:hypothetical protein